MNKLTLALATMGLIGDAVAADPLAATFPYDKPAANAALLFDASDRQSALADSLQSAGARRYSAFAGAPQLHFGALPENQSLLDPLGPLLNEHGKRFLSSAEFSRKLGRATGILTFGLLREAGGAPGEQHSMAMMLNTRPTTTFTSLSLGYALSARSALMAMATYGKTEGIGSPDSLLSQVSAVRTMAYSMGYVRRGIFASSDRLALTWSMPAKVRSAYDASGPAQADAAAPSYSGVPTLNLRPTATERDTELSYTRFFGRDGSRGRLTGAIMLRVNPGHDANAPPDWLTGVRYSYGF
ncbi:hypothetical protein [Duganella callida]|uniref:DUF2219 family protein n=1 Tax=Duganella callida TaxID=2561932 RepID=A0A4Y9S7L2_9BURK|nr:hypothetical protein [Duganella callida]TFW16489.1 hypothetical protein E4L98_23560 [Duganella callida]